MAEEETKEKPSKSPVILSIQFLKTLALVISHKDELYIYDKTHFTPLKDKPLHRLIFKFFEDKKILPLWRKNKANEMVEALKVNSQIKDVEELDPNKNLINLKNTVFNLDKLETQAHNQNNLFSYELDITHDPHLTSDDHPVFTQFLNDLFRNPDNTIDTDTKDLILFIMAYLIYPQIKMDKIFVFLGGGSNGKSILLEIIKIFFPKQYVTSLSLNVISNEESFSRNSLFWSRLNISTEQKADKNKVSSEEVKKVASGEQISMRKLYNEPVDINPITKLILACNDFPYFQDNTDGILRRLCLVECKNQFLNKAKYAQFKDPQSHNVYPAKDKDELIKAIKKEKSAIFNTLITYLHELKERNWELPETANTEEIMEEYQEGADTLGAWLKEYYEVEDRPNRKQEASVDILYDFKEYYEENFPGKRFNYSIQVMGRKIKQIFKVNSARGERETTLHNSTIIKTQRVRYYAIKRKTPKPPDTLVVPPKPTTPPPPIEDQQDSLEFT